MPDVVALTAEEHPMTVDSRPIPAAATKQEARYAPALNPAYPASWWVIALSTDTARGRSEPVRALEKDLVLWRDDEGRLHCQAAHCLHLGAHLGYGAMVRGNTLQCPFHGWGYDDTGSVVTQVGPSRHLQNRCLPTYRIMERDGVVYLWNGDGEPDHVIPDLYEHYGVSRQDFITVPHRLYMPFPAKYFAENICDGMHLAFAHGAAEWGEAVALEETSTMIKIENRLHNYRPWYTWANLKRLYRQGELVNIFTPVRGSLIATSFGATIHLTHIENTGNWGDHLVCWTPCNENDHHFFAIDVVPRPRVPLVGPLLEKAMTRVLRLGLYSTAAQDVALLRHRVESPKPPYAPFDKGLIAFRRHWDSRIVGDGNAQGDGIHSNGPRAGIRSGLRGGKVGE